MYINVIYEVINQWQSVQTKSYGRFQFTVIIMCIDFPTNRMQLLKTMSLRLISHYQYPKIKTQIKRSQFNAHKHVQTLSGANRMQHNTINPLNFIILYYIIHEYLHTITIWLFNLSHMKRSAAGGAFRCCGCECEHTQHNTHIRIVFVECVCMHSAPRSEEFWTAPPLKRTTHYKHVVRSLNAYSIIYYSTQLLLTQIS